MKNNFWNDIWFGGPLYNPVYTYNFSQNEAGTELRDSEGHKIVLNDTRRDIPNDLSEILDREWYATRDRESTHAEGNSTAATFSGLFTLRNLRTTFQSSYFYDYTWYATNLTSEDYYTLKGLDNTNVTEDTSYRRFENYDHYINGWGRRITYQSAGGRKFNGSTHYDPNDK